MVTTSCFNALLLSLLIELLLPLKVFGPTFMVSISVDADAASSLRVEDDTVVFAWVGSSSKIVWTVGREFDLWVLILCHEVGESFSNGRFG